MSLNRLRREIVSLKNPEKARILSSFFKTGKGEYGEGDRFLGLTVPQQRIIAKKYFSLSLNEISSLLHSPFHEERLTALLILVGKYNSSPINEKSLIIEFYLHHTNHINNWDLVDLSADKLLGNYLVDKDKTILYRLVKSSLLWEKRIAIVSTFAFIRQNKFDDTFKISQLLLQDKHDLIHKSVGWMRSCLS